MPLRLVASLGVSAGAAEKVDMFLLRNFTISSSAHVFAHPSNHVHVFNFKCCLLVDWKYMSWIELGRQDDMAPYNAIGLVQENFKVRD